MTLVRRHLVGAVALVLALAIGIALGAGPLSREIAASRRRPNRAGRHRPSSESADDLAEAVAPTVAGDRLAGRAVARDQHPGVSPDDARRAGRRGSRTPAATCCRPWQVGESLVGPGETALVDTLGSQLLEQLGDDGGRRRRPRRTNGWGSCSARPSPPAARRRGRRARTRSRSGRASTPPACSSTEAEEPRAAPLVLVVLGDDLDDDVVDGLVDGPRRPVAAGRRGGPGERDGDLAVLDETRARSRPSTASTVRPAGWPRCSPWPAPRRPRRVLRCVGCRRRCSRSGRIEPREACDAGQARVRHRRRRLLPREGAHGLQPGQPAEGARSAGHHAEAGPLPQRRSRDDEPVPARRGVRHRRRRRDRPRHRPLRAVPRHRPRPDRQRDDRAGLLDGDRQGAPRRLPRRHRAGDPAHHQRDQGPDPRHGRGPAEAASTS